MPDLAQSQIDTEPGLILMEKVAIGAAAPHVSFATGITAAFEEYRIAGRGIRMSADDREVRALLSQDAGANWLAGGTDYDFALFHSSANANLNLSASDAAYMTLVGGSAADWAVGNAAGESASFTAHLYRPASASLYKLVEVTNVFMTANGVVQVQRGWGRLKANANAVNGVRLQPESGTFTAGVFTLHAVRSA